jgi:hypothetical protein
VSGTGQDILAGGLFEDGSLFEEEEGGLASERVPPSESIGTTFADDPYPGIQMYSSCSCRAAMYSVQCCGSGSRIRCVLPPGSGINFFRIPYPAPFFDEILLHDL